MAQGHTDTVRNDKIVKTLNELIHLDFDAIEAYEAAIERLDDTTARTKLQEFMQDHVRHTENLAQLVRQHGGTPSMKKGPMAILTKGKVVIANLAGDKAILGAMRMNEEVTNKKYESALKTDGLDASTRQVIEQNLQDERRHREWLNARLGHDSN